MNYWRPDTYTVDWSPFGLAKAFYSGTAIIYISIFGQTYRHIRYADNRY
jgi:hypothetical protein